jgi:thiol:disulfide interchange protein
VLTLIPPADVKVGRIKYPEGKSEKVKDLDKPLSVYEKQFQISVPLTVSKDAILPLTVPATLTYQACQGAVCYRPEKLKFEISLKPAGPKK